MSGAWIGAALGGLAAAGAVLAVLGSPRMRRPTMVDRLEPFLADPEAPARLLTAVHPQAPFLAVRRLLGPVLAECGRAVDRTVGGAASIRRRLRGLGVETTVEEFRLEQVVWGAIGAVGTGAAVAGLTVLRGRLDVLLVLVGVLVGAIGGVLMRDWWLRRQLEQREQTMIAEFPVVADLLALAVVAGEAPLGALTRVCALTRGELARDLSGALAKARAGAPITRALSELAEQTTVDPFARFLQGFVVAIERGTPLADVLRAQAADVREYGKRALLEAGGRKEVAMLVPIRIRQYWCIRWLTLCPTLAAEPLRRNPSHATHSQRCKSRPSDARSSSVSPDARTRSVYRSTPRAVATARSSSPPTWRSASASELTGMSRRAASACTRNSSFARNWPRQPSRPRSKWISSWPKVDVACA